MGVWVVGCVGGCVCGWVGGLVGGLDLRPATDQLRKTTRSSYSVHLTN